MKLYTVFKKKEPALVTLILAFFTSFNLFAQPANDDPCNATALTPGSSCTFVSATNVAATNTAGVTAPGCASYSGQDVWFSVVVPAGGVLNIDSNTGTMTDGGMAAYTGTCGALTLLACDDDSSPNGLMPYLSLSGLTPGSTLYLRFWDYGGGTGSFSICVVAPPPPPPMPTPQTRAARSPRTAGHPARSRSRTSTMWQPRHSPSCCPPS